MKRKDVPIQIDKLIQDTFEEPCEEKFDDLFHKLHIPLKKTAHSALHRTIHSGP